MQLDSRILSVPFHILHHQEQGGVYVVQIQKPNFLPNQGTMFCLLMPLPRTFFAPICQTGDSSGRPSEHSSAKL